MDEQTGSCSLTLGKFTIRSSFEPEEGTRSKTNAGKAQQMLVPQLGVFSLCRGKNLQTSNEKNLEQV